MKSYDETIRTVLEGRDAAVAKQTKQKKTFRRALTASACCLAVILIGVGVWHSGILTGKTPALPPETEAPGTTLPAAETYPAPGPDVTGKIGAPGPVSDETEEGDSLSVVTGTTQSAEATEIQPSETLTDDGSGFGGNYLDIPLIPFDRTIVTVGEKITDEEAAAYFAETGGRLFASLSASGVPADSLRISKTGYCHVCYSGLEGEQLEVRENFRDYLVYNGDALVAIVTLYKEDGKLYETPSFGAAWFADYNAFLNAHRGQELVYVYAGFTEIILTPDGGIYSALPSIVAERYMAGTDDPYHVFYHPGAVYVP